jgi:hypothetical protein
MTRTKAEFDDVKQLMREGLSDRRIARLTGIPHPTVRTWRHREQPPGGRSHRSSWRVPDAYAYCYLLGCYLGDGNVAHPSRNGWELRLACDQRYVDIMDEIRAAAVLTFPNARPTTFASSTAASAIVRISHPGIAQAFPQHGPGRKHLRRIVLADWQTELTHREPEALIRGLIHSDGCRAENHFHTKLPSGRVAEYRYVRYFFSNLSADIRQIFIDHCALLRIRVTQSNARNLSVSHRDSVAILEGIVGPKT